MAYVRAILILVCAFGLAATAAAEPTPAFGARLAAAASEQARRFVLYDPSYVVIPYPWGDVPAGRGVCADVVVRAYRALGVDLQQRVHEDMSAAFSEYPDDWGLTRPDPNIDHRRVLNLATFFARHGASLPPTDDPASFLPGDVVTWNLAGERGFRPHMGVVVDRVARSGQPMIAHNIGLGVRIEDVLFDWEVTGHYRYEVAAGEEDRAE